MDEADIEYINRLMNELNTTDPIIDQDELNVYANDPLEDNSQYDEIEEIQAILYGIYRKYLDIEEYQADYLANLDKLKEYKYVSNPRELKLGDYVRYIEMKEPGSISLNQGGIVDKIDSSIQLKSIRNYKSIWRISFKSIIFVKLKG